MENGSTLKSAEPKDKIGRSTINNLFFDTPQILAWDPQDIQDLSSPHWILESRLVFLGHENQVYGLWATEVGYDLTHLFYMDDLKFCAGSRIKLQKLLGTLLKFSNDIHKKLGLDMCRKPHLERRETNAELGLRNKALIKNMTKEISYKYLGVLHVLVPCYNVVKDALTNAPQKFHKSEDSSTTLLEGLRHFQCPSSVCIVDHELGHVF